MSEKLQLEIGKKYKTRRGDAVTICQKLTHKNGGDAFLEDYPYRGSNGFHYSKEGRLIRCFESTNDIVEEIPIPA